MSFFVSNRHRRIQRREKKSTQTIANPIHFMATPPASIREDHSNPSSIQMSPPSGLERSNRTHRPSGDHTG